MIRRKKENLKPETELDKRFRLRIELMQTLNHYDINPRTIHHELRDKWKNYDWDFLANGVASALHHAYHLKGVMSYFDDGTEHMAKKIESHVKNFLRKDDRETERNRFPIDYYYVGGTYKDDHYIVCFDENCVVERDASVFDLLFALQFSLTPILECREFLNYQLEKSFKGNIAEFTEYLENICLEHKEFLAEKQEPFCRKYITELFHKKEAEEPVLKTQLPNTVKLKWLGSPSQFSYIFLQLAEKGFIELPSTNGQGSYSRYAKVCWDLFEFQNKTTQENLQKEMNPNKNTLSEGVQAKFTFPSLDEISKKPKK